MHPIPILVAAALAAALAATPAGAVDMPKRKSGLWELASTRDTPPPPGGAKAPQPIPPIRMCIDEKTDDLSRQLGENASREMCSKRDMRREGDRLVVDAVCKVGESTATTHSVMSGRFDSAYEVDLRTTFVPPMMGMRETHTVIRARWLGPCAPGQRPGDVIMPNGMTMNLLDAEKAAPGK